MEVLQLGGSTENTFSGVEKFRKSTYRAGNATPGTGIVSLPAAATFDATESLMTVYNTASVAGNAPDIEIIQPIALRLTNTVTNTAATDFRIHITLDTKDRYTSGGTTLTSNNLYLDTTTSFSQRTAKARVDFGTLVTNAASADVVVVASQLIRSSIFIAGESTYIQFGSSNAVPNVLNREADVILATPVPINIGRGCTMTVHAYGTSQTGGVPAWEVEFFYVEHPPTDVNS